MRNANPRLIALVRQAVDPLGYELVGIEHLTQSPVRSVLRVYIDRPAGAVTLDDCVAVSHQLGGLLEVEDPIPGQYDLEVSSPGLDRPLFSPEHFVRFTGQLARIRLTAKLEGRRNLEGRLAGVTGDRLHLEVGGEILALPLEMIDRARLVPQF